MAMMNEQNTPNPTQEANVDEYTQNLIDYAEIVADTASQVIVDFKAETGASVATLPHWAAILNRSTNWLARKIEDAANGDVNAAALLSLAKVVEAAMNHVADGDVN